MGAMTYSTKISKKEWSPDTHSLFWALVFNLFYISGIEQNSQGKRFGFLHRRLGNKTASFSKAK